MRYSYTYNNTGTDENLLFSKNKTIAKQPESNFLYVKTNHLGNVRATIKGISAGVYQLTTRTDYYAFGGVQPGRTYNLNTYRYNYQGQESAVNSRWQAFDLRMHNSDLGRWFAPDPYGQFHSPYVSMGNNPISGVDPDGGYVNGGNQYYNSMNGGTGKNWNSDHYFYSDGKWFESQKYAMEYRKDWGNRYRTALSALEQKYGGTAGLYSDAGYDELFNLMASYGIANMQSYSSGMGMSNFAHGGSIAVLEMMGQDVSRSYEAQESNKIQTLASLGGYEGKDGNMYTMGGNGEFGYTENVEVAALAHYGDPNQLHQAGIAAKYSVFHSLSGAQGGGGRNYGGDGSGSFMDNALYIADQINQFNPIANAWDAVTGYMYGTDRLGNSQSTLQTTLKVASIIPIGKVGSMGASVIEGVSAHGVNQAITRGFSSQSILQITRQGTSTSAMGRYGLQTRYTLGGNTVVVNSKGNMITVFSTAENGMFIPFGQ